MIPPRWVRGSKSLRHWPAGTQPAKQEWGRNHFYLMKPFLPDPQGPQRREVLGSVLLASSFPSSFPSEEESKAQGREMSAPGPRSLAFGPGLSFLWGPGPSCLGEGRGRGRLG